MRLVIATATAMLLLIGSAAAASVPEFQGTLAGPVDLSTSTQVDRDIVDVEAEPLPVLGEEITLRDLGPADVAAMFGVVDRSADGTVTNSPAAQSVLDALAGLAASRAQAPAGTDREVMGTDDRERINNATTFPFRAVGYLRIQRDETHASGCSATLIGPSTIITAGHCVYKPMYGDGWPVAMTFAPGANSPDVAPYGRIDYDHIFVVAGFVATHGEDYTAEDMETDLAVVTLKAPVGNQVGWLGYMEDAYGTFDAHLLGYPGDKPKQTMWRADCTVMGAEQYLNYLAHICDTYHGSSGAGMYWADPSGNRFIRAVNVASTESRNYAVRLNPVYFAWMKPYVR